MVLPDTGRDLRDRLGVRIEVSEGFTKVGVSIVTVIVMILSFVLLAQGMKTLPLETAYAIWTGIGAAGTAIMGMFLLNEPKT